MLVGGEIASKTANLRFLRAPASDLKVRLARQPLTKEDTISRSRHIAKITSGAAIEHVRSYLLSEAARLGLGEEVDAADCRKLLALLQDMRRSLETIERRGGLVVVSSTQTLITTYRCEGYRPQRKPHRCSPHLSMSERGFIKERGLMHADGTMAAPPVRLW